MKLISCYIQNFGGLSGYSLQFQPGLTVVSAPNGFGKTTLAEFIKAMLYGFPRARQELQKNTRKKYQPWQGGTYGGNLVFSHGGKTYRVERTFGTVPKQDTFLLYNLETNQISRDYSENLGQEIFQLDADSYARSTYLPQMGQQGPLTTDSIQAKLSNLVEDTGDVNNYEKALEALKEKRSFYRPYRGVGGQLDQAQRQISQLQTELAGAEAVYANLESRKQLLARMTAEQEKAEQTREILREKILAASEEAAREMAYQQYASLTLRADQIKNRETDLLAGYPGGIPQDAELTELDRLADEQAGYRPASFRPVKHNNSKAVLISSLVLLVLGGILAAKLLLPGILLLVLGLAGLIGAAYLNLKTHLKQEISAVGVSAGSAPDRQPEADRILKPYGLEIKLSDRAALQKLHRDREAADRLQQERNEAEAELGKFSELHGQALEEAPKSPGDSLESLKQRESLLNQRILELSRKRAPLEEEIRQLQNQADEIPEKQDNLEIFLQKKQEALDKSRILDQAIACLQQAKQALSGTYLGTIQNKFATYMQWLAGEEEENLRVSSDLQVQLQRHGAARELDYFSAGQADLVAFCMRLALVDTLFGESRPLIILDDPFINLDDDRTEDALRLLQDMSKDHQILYLVCNSSRTI